MVTYLASMCNLCPLRRMHIVETRSLTEVGPCEESSVRVGLSPLADNNVQVACL